MNIPFWRWVTNEAGERTLFLDGVIASESWYDDDVTPEMFRKELHSGEGPVTIWLNSPGGDVWAAAQIYNMLMEYPGNITIKIDGIAASAASVIAMAGGDIFMSPVAMMMMHNPSTFAIGDAEEMVRAKAMLDEVKESIISAYELKTGLSRAEIADMMDAETWLNARKAVELGFADDILYTRNKQEEHPAPTALVFSRQAVTNRMLRKLMAKHQKPPLPPEQPEQPAKPDGTPIESLEQRLNLLSH
ncbi:Clp protease ClpP [Eubacteriales bacterium OttesenSCG-928-A19]|nr:Clp protease ClpP [Eubacteriales bacterium OttesenSCG-928-A19]